MVKKINLGDITAEIILKDIKNIHLSVYPPRGRVRISAPARMDIETIRVFAISKLGWIKQQQRRLLNQDRETPREYLDRESHYIWGKRYLLKVIEANKPALVELKHTYILLRVRPGSTRQKKQSIVDEWYREQLKEATRPIIEKWEPILRVKVARLHVQHMKTKWGGCNSKARSIRLNTELAKKPSECLEYIIVHELVHLLEPTHNARFISMMDKLIPQWRFYRDQLNQLPVHHEEWTY